MPRRLALLAFGLVLALGSLARAGDDTVFTLVVTRPYKLLQGRAVNYNIYIDGKFIAGVANGTVTRFAIPATSESGVYTVSASGFGGALGNGTEAVKTFTARPGDCVSMRVWIDKGYVYNSFVIDQFRVDPLEGQARVQVLAPSGGATLVIKGPKGEPETFAVDERGTTLSTLERTTRGRYVRLRGTATSPRWAAPKELVVFAGAARSSLLDLAAFDEPGYRLLPSINFLLQMRACVFHHLGSRDNAELAAVLDKLEADLAGLPTAGVHDNLLDLRTKYVAYFRDVDRLSKAGVLGPLVGELLMSAFQIAAEAYFTQTTVTATKVIQETLPAVLGAAYQKYQLNAELREANAKFDAAEQEVVRFLKDDLSRHATAQGHPLVAELFGAP